MGGWVGMGGCGVVAGCRWWVCGGGYEYRWHACDMCECRGMVVCVCMGLCVCRMGGRGDDKMCLVHLRAIQGTGVEIPL